MRTTPTRHALALACLSTLAACGGATGGPASTGAPADGAAGATPATPPPSSSTGPGWVTVAHEDFEQLDLGSAAWEADREPRAEDGPYGDQGAYFVRKGTAPPPAAFRLSKALGAGGWLTADSYTRDA